MTEALTTALTAAFTDRTRLLEQLHAEQTDAYRLFHGSVEGYPGLTIDRYGELLLVQSFHSPLQAAELAAVEQFYAQAVPGLITVFNDRSGANSRIGNPLPPDQLEAASQRALSTKWVSVTESRGDTVVRTHGCFSICAPPAAA